MPTFSLPSRFKMYDIDPALVPPLDVCLHLRNLAVLFMTEVVPNSSFPLDRGESQPGEAVLVKEVRITRFVAEGILNIHGLGYLGMTEND